MPAFFFLQVLFQKRAPSARALVYVLVVASVLSVLRGKRKMVLCAGILLCIVLSFVAISYREAFGLLINRFRSNVSIGEMDRLQEAQAMLKDFAWWEFFVGRGMGGSFAPPEGWQSGIQIISIDGKQGRADLHIGMLEPLLKGGLCLSICYFSFFVVMILPKRKTWYRDDYNLTGLIIIFVYGLFLCVEGPPTFAAPSNAMLVGLICARGGMRQGSIERNGILLATIKR
jgi:hypothetical protein